MSSDFFRYDLLTQEALRSVIRRVLDEAASAGMPGEHHFFISFNPNYSGVRLSQRLRQQYPNEMTIVLQHQFWDLVVSDTGFEVGLSFGGVPEKLAVPFESITGFFDPSVQFGLKFELQPDSVTGTLPTAQTSASEALRQDEMPGAEETGAAAADDEAAEDDQAHAGEPAIPLGVEGSAEIVSLDKFRKK
jgi:hypothetical protein